MDRLRAEGIAPTPEMYELWFVFYANMNPDVVKELKLMSAKPGMVTAESCQAIYEKHLSHNKAEEAVKRAGEQIQETISGVNKAVADVKTRTETYNQSLQKTVRAVEATDDPKTIRSALGTLVTDTKTMMETSNRLHSELDKSSRIIEDLQRDLEKVRREAMTDGLTGLVNRKAFDQEIEKLLAETEATGVPFTLIMVDIDHFKSFNDNFGHQVGDQVLRLVARTLIEGIKGRDIAARYGGEEFAILLPESNIMAGVAVGNALRKAIAMKDVINRNTGEKLGRITMSAGVAEHMKGESVESIIERADAALYTAKHNGRNQVAAAPASGKK